MGRRGQSASERGKKPVIAHFEPFYDNAVQGCSPAHAAIASPPKAAKPRYLLRRPPGMGVMACEDVGSCEIATGRDDRSIRIM